MADQTTGFTVELSDGVRAEEAEAIAAAIRLIRGVASVQPIEAGADQQDARERVNAEWRQRIVGLLDDEGV